MVIVPTAGRIAEYSMNRARYFIHMANLSQDDETGTGAGKNRIQTQGFPVDPALLTVPSYRPRPDGQRGVK